MLRRPRAWERIQLASRAVGLRVLAFERPGRKPTSRPRPLFCFYPLTQTEGAPLYTAKGYSPAEIWLAGYAEARGRALRAEAKGLTIKEAMLGKVD